MALEYQLVLRTESPLASLLEAVRQRCALLWSKDDTFLIGTGVQVSGGICGRSWQQTFQEEFGFRPKVQLFFRMAKAAEELRAGSRVMLAVVVDVLRQEAGPAVLLANGETILLQRLDQELLLNRDWQSWQHDGLDLLTLPYRMQSLPSPLL